jgi:hypothetical protein
VDRHRQQIQRDEELVGATPTVSGEVASLDDERVVSLIDDRPRNEQRRSRRILVVIARVHARRQERHDKKRNQQALHGGSRHRRLLI